MSSSILVADYGSSDSENDEEITVDKNKLELKEVSSSSGVNLLASTEDKSDSDDDVASTTTRTQDEALPNHGTKSSQKEPEKLPLPSVIGLLPDPSAPCTLAPSSIFANPFEEAEQHKLSILEQHVKLTSAQTKEAELGGKKKICWKFRNGRCRFGHKCKFAHDSDIPSTLAVTSSHQESLHMVQAAGSERTSSLEESIPYEGWSKQGEGEDGEEEVQKRKRRPGLSQTLTPSKKVMTAYNRQNMQENPWTQRR